MSQYEENTEERILSLIEEGDEYAYELVFRRYYSSLCGFSTRFVKQPEVAEGIVQDVFLKLWDKRKELKITISLKSYLFRAVYNSALNHLEHLKVESSYRKVVRNTNMQKEELKNSVLNELAYKEMDEKITKAINCLPESCRTIFKLSRFEGLKYKEIATKLGISKKTVETQISRALSRLRIDLAEYIQQR